MGAGVLAIAVNAPLLRFTVPNCGPFGPTVTTNTEGPALADRANITGASKTVSACVIITTLANAAALLIILNVVVFMFSPF